jgi:hypothetical protein
MQGQVFRQGVHVGVDLVIRRRDFERLFIDLVCTADQLGDILWAVPHGHTDLGLSILGPRSAETKLPQSRLGLRREGIQTGFGALSFSACIGQV